MIDETLTDRDQEERLRQFLRDNWRWMAAGVVLGLAGLVGYNKFHDSRRQTLEAAAAQFAELQATVAKGDQDTAAQQLRTLTEQYGRSPYVSQAQLLLARAHVEKGEFDDAATLLQKVIDTTKDKELADLARLRLARVLLQQGKHDAALAALKLEEDSAFAPLAHEIRGDVHYALGKTAEARAEYAAALEGDSAAIDRPLVELKLQQVGGTPEDPVVSQVSP